MEFSGSEMKCSTALNEKAGNAEFAFYIYRNEEKIHTIWYSTAGSFTFDTGGNPGYYRVLAFLKVDGEFAENIKSAPIFANPVAVTAETLSLADGNCVAYMLNGNSWSFPALYYPGSKSKSLFVMLPSAADRKKMTLPVFSRWTWATKGVFPGNVLCIADPTLDLSPDLGLGWMLGKKESCATTELAGFIIDLAQREGIPHHKIVIYGSSAGGFAALALAACIEGATAVAINTQTHALSYEISRQVALVRQHCFDNLTAEEILHDYPERVNMEARWKNVKESKVFLVQNLTDVHHYDVHFSPFWKSLGGDPVLGISHAGRHTAWLYEQEGGHIPETMEMAREIISMLQLNT